MDTTGTFEIASVLAHYKCLTAIHKFYSAEEWKAFATNKSHVLPFVSVSAGTSKSDFEVAKDILNEWKGIQMICLDVANGYSKHFIDTVSRYRETFPDHIIMAGNIVTPEMT